MAQEELRMFARKPGCATCKGRLFIPALTSDKLVPCRTCCLHEVGYVRDSVTGIWECATGCGMNFNDPPSSATILDADSFPGVLIAFKGPHMRDLYLKSTAVQAVRNAVYRKTGKEPPLFYPNDQLYSEGTISGLLMKGDMTAPNDSLVKARIEKYLKVLSEAVQVARAGKVTEGDPLQTETAAE